MEAVVYMILMDEKVDKIQATAKKVLMYIFENQLEEGNIILLSRFGVGQMNFKYHVIKHNFKLNFYRQTNIERCLEFDGPLYGFRFVDFHQIINRHVQEAASYTEDSEVQTDICKDHATSSGCKQVVAAVEKDDNVEASSTKTGFKRIKIEKL
ncbi:hypothetical protein R6Q59_010256 [Mikania micrantha]